MTIDGFFLDNEKRMLLVLHQINFSLGGRGKCPAGGSRDIVKENVEYNEKDNNGINLSFYDCFYCCYPVE